MYVLLFSDDGYAHECCLIGCATFEAAKREAQYRLDLLLGDDSFVSSMFHMDSPADYVPAGPVILEWEDELPGALSMYQPLNRENYWDHDRGRDVTITITGRYDVGGE